MAVGLGVGVVVGLGVGTTVTWVLKVAAKLDLAVAVRLIFSSQGLLMMTDPTPINIAASSIEKITSRKRNFPGMRAEDT